MRCPDRLADLDKAIEGKLPARREQRLTEVRKIVRILTRLVGGQAMVPRVHTPSGSGSAVAGESLTTGQRGRQAPACPCRPRRNLRHSGRPGRSASTIARKRSVFANVIRYAVELEELPSNPLDRLSWKPRRSPGSWTGAWWSTRVKPGNCSPP